MDFSSIPSWLDSFLISPFRWPDSPLLGMWLGSALIAAYCILVGELLSACLYLAHKRYYTSMQDSMLHYHNLSVQALHSGNKEAYLSANKMAQEDFGKSFFAQATIGLASLLPLPFALGWLSTRFEGIVVHNFSLFGLEAGYVFVFLGAYIVLRILFGRFLKKRLPLFGRIEEMKKMAREARGQARSFFNPPSDTVEDEAALSARDSKEAEPGKTERRLPPSA